MMSRISNNTQAISLLRRMPFRTTKEGVAVSRAAVALVDHDNMFCHVAPGGVREFARRSHWQFSQRLRDGGGASLRRLVLYDDQCWVKLRSQAEALDVVRHLDESVDMKKTGRRDGFRVFPHPDDAYGVLVGTQGRLSDSQILERVQRRCGVRIASNALAMCTRTRS